MRLRAGCLAFLLCVPALAGMAEERPLRLDDLVSLALRQNAEILAAEKKYEAAGQRPVQAGSLPDPMFSPGWNSNGNPLPGAGIGSNPTSNIGFAVSQQIPYPGKRRLRTEAASKQVEVEFESLEVVRRSVVSQVKQAFFKLQHSYNAMDVLERNRELLKKLLAVTEISYSSGKAAQQDVFKAQLQLSLLEGKILQLQRERRLRQVEINSLLNRPGESVIGNPAEPHVAPIAKTLEELQAAALHAAPARRRDQKMAEAADLSVSVASRDFYPDPTLSAGYYNQAGMPAFYTFRADIPIPLHKKRTAALSEQTLLAAEARHAYRATGQALTLRIADDYSSAETSLQLMDLYTKTVLPQARLTIDSSTVEYETGKVDFLSVLNNYTAVLDYEMNYHEEMLNFHLALSRLEEATGTRLIEENH